MQPLLPEMNRKSGRRNSGNYGSLSRARARRVFRNRRGECESEAVIRAKRAGFCGLCRIRLFLFSLFAILPFPPENPFPRRHKVL